MPAGVERVAACQPPQTQPGTTKQAEAFDRLRCVGAAGWHVAARWWADRADGSAIEGEHAQHQARRRAHGRRASRLRAASRSAPSSADVACAAPGRARTTRPLPCGTVFRRSANCARNRRLTRCRTTLPPTDLPTTRPIAGRSRRTEGCWCRTRWRQRARAPDRTTVANSVDRRSRYSRGSMWRRWLSAQADSSPRPLRRRAERMARPARVRIRSRKPWVLARRRLLGWKVRLVTVGLHHRVVGRPLQMTAWVRAAT